MLLLCLLSKEIAGFADCLFGVMIWKAVWSRFSQMYSVLDLMYVYFIKVILSASWDRQRQ